MATLGNNKKLVRSRSGLRIICHDNNLKSPFELREPNWVPDKESPSCTKCDTRFDFLTRRHHCRRCGQVFCNSCCMEKVHLPRMCFVDPVRMCDNCARVSHKENDFYNNHLKTLIAGANFQLICDHLRIIEEHGSSFYCRLSANYREILFDGGAHSQHDAVPLSQIISLKVFKGEDIFGEGTVGGVVITYGQNQETLKLQVASIPNPKQSSLWITALRRAQKILKEVEQD